MLWLQRDFGIYLANIFDTERACQVSYSATDQRRIYYIYFGFPVIQCRLQLIEFSWSTDSRSCYCLAKARFHGIF